MATTAQRWSTAAAHVLVRAQAGKKADGTLACIGNTGASRTRALIFLPLSDTGEAAP